MNQEEEKKKERISITFPPAFMRCLEELVDKGVYLDRGAIIREGVRKLFTERGLYPFSINDEESKRNE